MAKEPSARGKNFTVEELKLLCRSHLKIGQSSTVGNQQKIGTFWERIYTEYHANKSPSMDERPLKSLESKYGELKKDCNRFKGCYKTVVHMNKSGISAEDKMELAKQLFKKRPTGAKEQKNKPRDFAYECCYDIVLQDPKLGSPAESGGKAYTRKRPGEFDDYKSGNENALKQNDDYNLSARTAAVPDDGNPVEPGVSKVNLLLRPMGNKAAKAKEKFEKMEATTQRVAADAHKKMAEASVQRLNVVESQHLVSLLMMSMPTTLDEQTLAILKATRDEEILRLRKRIAARRELVGAPEHHTSDGRAASTNVSPESPLMQHSPPTTENRSSPTIQSVRCEPGGEDELATPTSAIRSTLPNVSIEALSFENVEAEVEFLH